MDSPWLTSSREDDFLWPPVPCLLSTFSELLNLLAGLSPALTASLGVQITYVNRDAPDEVRQHGLTEGNPVMLASLPEEQILNKLVSFSNDRVNAMYLQSSNGTILGFAGSPTGTYSEMDKAIFGFYGPTKDNALVSLGFYTLIDFSAFRTKSPQVGGYGLAEVPVFWDDTGSYNGISSHLFYCPLCLSRASKRETPTSLIICSGIHTLLLLILYREYTPSYSYIRSYIYSDIDVVAIRRCRCRSASKDSGVPGVYMS